MKKSNVALWSFILVFITDALDRAQYIDFFPNLSGQTGVVTAIKYLSLLFLISLLISNGGIRRQLPLPGYYVLIAWCLWAIITIFRGLFTAQDYWEWRFLMTDNLLRYSVHFSFILGLYFTQMREIFSLILKVIFPASFVLLFLSSGEFDYFYSYIVMPVTLLIFAAPFVKHRYGLIILLVGICSVVFALDFRSNAIRLSFGLALVLIYYFNVFSYSFSSYLLRIVRLIVLVTPIVFLGLGVSGEFNVFRDSVKSDVVISKEGYDDNLSADTRTFLYIETFKTLLNNDTLIVGEGGAGSYISDYEFEYLVDKRRFATEVGFLNVLLHSGLVGVVLYFLVIVVSSYYSIFRSSNSLSKMLGLFVAFRWVVFYIEDMTAYNVNLFFFWISIGLCLSSKFRVMSDVDLISFFKKMVK